MKIQGKIVALSSHTGSRTNQGRIKASAGLGAVPKMRANPSKGKHLRFIMLIAS